MQKRRRDLLKWAMAGAGAFVVGPHLLRMGSFVGAPYGLGLGLDAFERLRVIAKFSQSGGTRSGFPWLASSAYAASAASDPEVCVVTVRVMNLIHTPLCLKLGKIVDPSTGAVAPYQGSFDDYPNANDWDKRLVEVVGESTGSTATRDHLLARGLDKVHVSPRFQNLRLNGWFGEMLATGRNDSGEISEGLTTADVGPFPPESEVALQTVLGINQNDPSLNHSFKNTGFLLLQPGTQKGGDLNNHVAATNLVNSPLGIVCLNMGNAVESTDGDSRSGNKVLGPDLLSIVANGSKVSDYVTLLRQVTSGGFIDDTLVAKFDDLGGVDARVPEELKKFKGALESASSQSNAAKALETMLHMKNLPGRGNLQNTADGLINQPARSEFLAQCRFVQAALELEGKPFRNFSLLLNTSDVDRRPLHLGAAISGKLVQSVSVVEGMRQLAIGMNMLAQSIKKHRNVYVVVFSEGGRGTNGGDNKASHAFIMGPGGSGGLKDAVYGNQSAINSDSDPHTIEPNEGGAVATNSPGLTNKRAGLRSPDGNVIVTEGGMPVSDSQKTLNLAMVLNGVVRQIESVQKALPTTGGLGPALVLQKA